MRTCPVLLLAWFSAMTAVRAGAAIPSDEAVRDWLVVNGQMFYPRCVLVWDTVTTGFYAKRTLWIRDQDRVFLEAVSKMTGQPPSHELSIFDGKGSRRWVDEANTLYVQNGPSFLMTLPDCPEDFSGRIALGAGIPDILQQEPLDLTVHQAEEGLLEATLTFQWNSPDAKPWYYLFTINTGTPPWRLVWIREFKTKEDYEARTTPNREWRVDGYSQCGNREVVWKGTITADTRNTEWKSPTQLTRVFVRRCSSSLKEIPAAVWSLEPPKGYRFVNFETGEDGYPAGERQIHPFGALSHFPEVGLDFQESVRTVDALSGGDNP